MIAPSTAFELKYWNLFSRVDPEEDLRPLNLRDEENKYLESIRRGVAYSAPQFQYRDHDIGEYIVELDILKENIEDLNTDLHKFYHALINDLHAWLSMFLRRDQELGSCLYGLFGKPESDVVNKAREFVNSCVDRSDSFVHTEIVDPIHYFNNVLSEYGFSGWKFVVTSMPAKVRISNPEKCIYIKEGDKFSRSDLERLSKHEIGTHVLRHENGHRGEDVILRYGTPGYLETEEGLAIYSEELCGLLTLEDMKKYCLRVIASDMAREYGFNEIFDELRRYTSTENAFSITTRVKRGISDTAQKGGYSKDQVYYSGLLKVRKLSDSDLKSLYIGKIGIGDLDWASTKDVPEKNIIPSWIHGRQK